MGSNFKTASQEVKQGRMLGVPAFQTVGEKVLFTYGSKFEIYGSNWRENDTAVKHAGWNIKVWRCFACTELIKLLPRPAETCYTLWFAASWRRVHTVADSSPQLQLKTLQELLEDQRPRSSDRHGLSSIVI